jgi:hypothetical protein
MILNITAILCQYLTLNWAQEVMTMKYATIAVLLFLGPTRNARADIYEVVVSKFKPGLTHQKEVALTRSLNDFVTTRPGFRKREVFYDQKQKYYVDVIRWLDESSAKEAAKAAEQSPTCQPVFSQIEEKGMIFLHAEKILEFNK